MFSADPKKPIGGNILAHASTTRWVWLMSAVLPHCSVTNSAVSSAACTWGRAEERPGSVRFMTLLVCRKLKPCLPSMLMEWVMPRTKAAEWELHLTTVWGGVLALSWVVWYGIRPQSWTSVSSSWWAVGASTDLSSSCWSSVWHHRSCLKVTAHVWVHSFWSRSDCVPHSYNTLTLQGKLHIHNLRYCIWWFGANEAKVFSGNWTRGFLLEFFSQMLAERKSLIDEHWNMVHAFHSWPSESISCQFVLASHSSDALTGTVVGHFLNPYLGKALGFQNKTIPHDRSIKCIVNLTTRVCVDGWVGVKDFKQCSPQFHLVSDRSLWKQRRHGSALPVITSELN